MSKRNYYNTEEWSSSCKKIRRIKEEETSTGQQSTSLLDLNVYCLLQIFKNLQLTDKIHCALACRGLTNFYFVEMASRHKTLSKADIRAISRMAPADVRHFFKATAQFIEEADISDQALDVYTLDLLFRYGVNIKRVNMTRAEAHFPILLTYGRSVESLNASFCKFGDEEVKTLQRLPKLRVLRLNWNHGVTGKYLASYSHLEELYLDYDALEAKQVQKFAKCCIQLRILDISMFGMDVETSQVISQYCSRLELLCFRDAGEDFSALAQLPNLRRLAINDAKLPSLRALAERNPDQLEDLRVMGNLIRSSLLEAIAQFKNLKILRCQGRWDHYEYFRRDILGESLNMLCSLEKLEKLLIVNSISVQDEMVLGVLKRCTNLNYLAVLGCPFITQAFVFNTIDLLKERRAERKKTNNMPFVLIADETSFKDSVLKDKRYRDSSAIFKLHIIEPCAVNYSFNFQDDFMYGC